MSTAPRRSSAVTASSCRAKTRVTRTFITSRICGICGDNHATCAVYAAEHGVRRQNTAAGRVDHQPRRSGRIHVRPLHLSGQPCRRGLLRAAWSRRPTPACSNRPRKPKRPMPRIHGFRTIGDIMESLNPFTGAFYREALQMSRLTRRDVLPDGRSPRSPLHALSRRRRHRAEHAGVHRLSRAADEICRVHEARRADAR